MPVTTRAIKLDNEGIIMRYFTKQWYIDSLISDMCFQLRKTEKAGEYSDKFFEKLYAVEEKAYLRFSKRSSKLGHLPFDEKAVRAEFASNYKDNLEFVKANLPNDILSDVKDIRVLALGSATHEIAMRITRFCGKKNRLCESAERKYNDASEEADEKLGGFVTKTLFELVGAPISLLSGCGDGNATLTTSHEKAGTAIKVSFENAQIVECDESIIGTTVLKYEILTRDSGGYEFSVLSIGEGLDLYTATLVCDSIGAEEI